MMISSGVVKRFIFDVVYYTGEKDLSGKPVSRTSFATGIWKVAIKLRERLINEVEVAVLNTNGEKSVWKPLKEVGKDDKIVSERFRSGDFELSDAEILFIKDNIKASTELPLIESDYLSELSSLID